MDRIYFDNSSTSFPKAPGVADAISEFLNTGAYNVGRGGYEDSYNISSLIIDTRARLKRLFNAGKDYEVCFNSGVTFSINQFLFGYLRAGDHIVVSSLEHNAVMRPLRLLEKEGIQVDIAPLNEKEELDLETLNELIKPNTKAMLFTYVSNVCGSIMPLEQIGNLCKQNNICFAVDSAQGAGVLPIDVIKMNIDFLAFAGHKGLRGPQGVGGFLITKSLAKELKPIITGGTGSRSDEEIQPDFLPDKFESGTLPIPAIIGLRQALIYLDECGIETVYHKEMVLTKAFLDEVSKLPNVRIAGISRFDPEKRTAVVSLDFINDDNAQVAFFLEQEAGIMTRVGLHCAPQAHKTIGTFPQGTVRFSFGPDNTLEEVDKCIKHLKKIL